MTKAAVSTSFHAEAVPMSGGGAGEKSEDPETQSKFLETPEFEMTRFPLFKRPVSVRILCVFLEIRRVGVAAVCPPPTMAIKFVLLVNKQGQTRVAQYYEHKVSRTRTDPLPEHPVHRTTTTRTNAISTGGNLTQPPPHLACVPRVLESSQPSALGLRHHQPQRPLNRHPTTTNHHRTRRLDVSPALSVLPAAHEPVSGVCHLITMCALRAYLDGAWGGGGPKGMAGTCRVQP